VGNQVLEDIHQVLGGIHQEPVGNQKQEGTLQMEDILVLEDNPNKKFKKKQVKSGFITINIQLQLNIKLFINDETIISLSLA